MDSTDLFVISEATTAIWKYLEQFLLTRGKQLPKKLRICLSQKCTQMRYFCTQKSFSPDPTPPGRGHPLLSPSPDTTPCLDPGLYPPQKKPLHRPLTLTLVTGPLCDSTHQYEGEGASTPPPTSHEDCSFCCSSALPSFSTSGSPFTVTPHSARPHPQL